MMLKRLIYCQFKTKITNTDKPWHCLKSDWIKMYQAIAGGKYVLVFSQNGEAFVARHWFNVGKKLNGAEINTKGLD